MGNRLAKMLALLIFAFCRSPVYANTDSDLALQYGKCIAQLRNIPQKDIMAITHTETDPGKIGNLIAQKAIKSCEQERQKLLDFLKGNNRLNEGMLKKVEKIEAEGIYVVKVEVLSALMLQLADEAKNKEEHRN